jgi:hypothetical protein
MRAENKSTRGSVNGRVFHVQCVIGPRRWRAPGMVGAHRHWLGFHRHGCADPTVAATMAMLPGVYVAVFPFCCWRRHDLKPREAIADISSKMPFASERSSRVEALARDEA